MSKQVTVMGVRYPSIAKACETYGISQNVVNSRVRLLNWDLEVAITTPMNPHTRPVFLDGKLYRSIREVATVYDVKYHILLQRLANGWSLEEAITTPVQERRSYTGVKVRINGVSYNSIARAAEDYDIRVGTVYSRLRYGWSMEDAITSPLIPNGSRRKN